MYQKHQTYCPKRTIFIFESSRCLPCSVQACLNHDDDKTKCDGGFLEWGAQQR